ncbi:protein phosphatase 1 regulatory subunit 1A [Coturnix japonica]|uniref:protein phosphatase 1 regulatory subunit 1A n=1 Tax=Coturnix japonica TaxID=93934 RepID=UPI000777BF63|nr:protein phosphatase 1 regulatory subunit 1A [Coturnix japonica]
MEPNGPRKIQFTVPLLEPHLDPEAAEQVGIKAPSPSVPILSPEIDEDRLPNALLKSGLAMSPRQRKKVYCTTPTVKELQMMVEHHLCKQARGEDDDDVPIGAQELSTTCCHHGDPEHNHSPGGSCPLTPAQPTAQGSPEPGDRDERQSAGEEGAHIEPGGKGAAGCV